MNLPVTTTKIGIITIATGRYFEEFIPHLRASIEEYFHWNDCEIQFYCFTDATIQIGGVINIPIKHFAWPFSTLLRYRWIAQHLDILQHQDFLLYMDADMKVVSSPPLSIFHHPLIAVRHPGYLDTPGAFEIDRQDSCYVAPPLRKNYYQGCFWGGKTAQFVKLIKALDQQVDNDLGRGKIPIWHDESYLNHYLATHPCHALPSTYAWPEGQKSTITPYILHLEKKHQVIRQESTDRLPIKAFVDSNDAAAELAIYKKLYLNAHEKCQRLENRLVQKNIFLSQAREWISYFVNRPK